MEEISHFKHASTNQLMSFIYILPPYKIVVELHNFTYLDYMINTYDLKYSHRASVAIFFV